MRIFCLHCIGGDPMFTYRTPNDPIRPTILLTSVQSIQLQICRYSSNDDASSVILILTAIKNCFCTVKKLELVYTTKIIIGYQ